MKEINELNKAMDEFIAELTREVLKQEISTLTDKQAGLLVDYIKELRKQTNSVKIKSHLIIFINGEKICFHSNQSAKELTEMLEEILEKVNEGSITLKNRKGDTLKIQHYVLRDYVWFVKAVED